MTAFEGECRNIIELLEHLKLRFLVILNTRIATCDKQAWYVPELYNIGKY